MIRPMWGSSSATRMWRVGLSAAGSIMRVRGAASSEEGGKMVALASQRPQERREAHAAAQHHREQDLGGERRDHDDAGSELEHRRGERPLAARPAERRAG